MAKKKKTDKDFSLDIAIKETKKTKSTLQGLLQGVTEGKGYYRRKKEEEERINPQLTYTKKTQEELFSDQNEIITETPQESSVKKIPSFATASDIAELREARLDKYEELQVKIADRERSTELKAPKAPTAPTAPQAPPKGVYEMLTKFFSDYIKGYNERYQSWENSISSLLSILRKMRKITKKNTEDLEASIRNLYERTHTGLNQFKIKRDEIEKLAGINIQEMSGEFRRVLGLLELQIKEYQLKRFTDELFSIKKLYS